MFGLLDAIAIRLQVFAGTIDEHRIVETTVKDCQLLEPRRLERDSRLALTALSGLPASELIVRGFRAGGRRIRTLGPPRRRTT
jgi:hypothetical protein